MLLQKTGFHLKGYTTVGTSDFYIKVGKERHVVSYHYILNIILKRRHQLLHDITCFFVNLRRTNSKTQNRTEPDTDRHMFLPISSCADRESFSEGSILVFLLLF